MWLRSFVDSEQLCEKSDWLNFKSYFIYEVWQKEMRLSVLFENFGPKLIVPFKIFSPPHRITTLSHSSLPHSEPVGKVLFREASQLSCHAVLDVVYRCKMHTLHHWLEFREEPEVSRSEVRRVRRVVCDLLVGQQLPHAERSVCRRIVMVEHPGLVFPKSWSAAANLVVEAVED